MYLAEILKKLTELGFINWMGAVGENSEFYTANIGKMQLNIYSKLEKNSKKFFSIKKKYYVLKIHGLGHENVYQTDIDCEPNGIISLYYSAMASAERAENEIASDAAVKAVMQELVKEFGLRV